MPHPIELLEPRRLFAAGAVDPSFGTGGAVTLRADLTDYTESPSTKPVQTVVDAAGRTLVLTASKTEINLVRLTADGVLDTRFATATNGVLRLPYLFQEGEVTAPPPRIAVDANNRVLLLRVDTVTRFTSVGKLDRSFGNRGNAYLDDDRPAFNGADLAVGQNGKIWLVGTDIYSDVISFSIGRLTPDGEPDSSPEFTNGFTFPLDAGLTVNGRAVTRYTKGRLVRVLADGSVMFSAQAIGYGDYGDGHGVRKLTAVESVRYTPTGRPDRTFGRHGRAIYTVIGSEDASAPADAYPVGIRPDGSTVIYNAPIGQIPNNVTLTPDGQFGGAVALGPTLTSAQFVRQADGRELVVDTGAKTLRRVNADDSIDDTFNDGQPIGGVAAATVGTDGAILYAGTGKNKTDAAYVVRRVFSSEGPAGRLVPSTLVSPAKRVPFRVVWRDDDGVDAATVTASALRAVTPDGVVTRVSLTGLTEQNGVVVADYVLRAPGGRFTAEGNGVYAVRLRKDAVKDVDGNAAEARTLGSVVVNILT